MIFIISTPPPQSSRVIRVNLLHISRAQRFIDNMKIAFIFVFVGFSISDSLLLRMAINNGSREMRI